MVAKSTKLALLAIQYYKWLISEKKEFIISKQLLRSGTSIGANIREANYALSRADFISKMQIAVKEAAETEYWLYLLEESDYFDDQFTAFKLLLDEVKRMLVATLKTSKNNQ